MTMWEKIKETKGRFVVGYLVGTTLAIAWFLSYFIEIPKENEVTVAEIRSCFAMAFGAFIQHIMKTPDKEKLKVYEGNQSV